MELSPHTATLKPGHPRASSATIETTTMTEPQLKGSPCSPQLEKTPVQQQRLSTAKKKTKGDLRYLVLQVYKV